MDFLSTCMRVTDTNLAFSNYCKTIFFFSSKVIKQQEQQDTTAAFNATLKEKLNSLRQSSSNLQTRPLPDIPSEQIVSKPFHTSDISLFRRTTFTVPGTNKNAAAKEKENVFDAIKKPPSLVMERIKNSTAATLDRMAILQARYRQHKETMGSENSSDKSRRTSTASTIDSNVS